MSGTETPEAALPRFHRALLDARAVYNRRRRARKAVASEEYAGVLIAALHDQNLTIVDLSYVTQLGAFYKEQVAAAQAGCDAP